MRLGGGGDQPFETLQPQLSDLRDWLLFSFFRGRLGTPTGLWLVTGRNLQKPNEGDFRRDGQTTDGGKDKLGGGRKGNNNIMEQTTVVACPLISGMVFFLFSFYFIFFSFCGMITQTRPLSEIGGSSLVLRPMMKALIKLDLAPFGKVNQRWFCFIWKNIYPRNV